MKPIIIIALALAGCADTGTYVPTYVPKSTTLEDRVEELENQVMQQQSDIDDAQQESEDLRSKLDEAEQDRENQ